MRRAANTGGTVTTRIILAAHSFPLPTDLPDFADQVKFVFIESAVPTLKMIRSEILHVSADSFRFSFSVPASSVYVGLRQVSLLCFAVYFVSYSSPKASYCTHMKFYAADSRR